MERGKLLATGIPLGTLQIAVEESKMKSPILHPPTTPKSMRASTRPPLQQWKGRVIDLLMVPRLVKRTMELNPREVKIVLIPVLLRRLTLKNLGV